MGEAFQKVNGAMQKKAAIILRAEGYRDSRVPLAEGERVRKEADAHSYSARLKAIAPARAKRFEQQLAAYNKAPAVFVHRMRLDAIVAAIADRRKIITPTWANVDKVLNLDLKTVMSTSMMGTLDDISASEEETD